ncbi:class I SAM-dependent methyltransferase [Candidatus Nomurabacteria bacterium]|nr:class I SAM-dependent methyltransferase [Candidatus Nomurabacteria bacterium]USN94563.1 MAG: class I SAM-dependent methyltransferase [Candidatus Nomurabacteria bacterium]
MRKVAENTMLTPSGLFQMEKFIEDINKKSIPGAIVEAGCWKGGTGAYMAMIDKNRKVFLFDSFEGMPEPDTVDHKSGGKKGLKGGDLAVDENIVLTLKEKYNLKNIQVVKGYFENTLPVWKEKIGPIAILRMDGDFYSSTTDILENLYDQVSPGGYVVIDDWHDFNGCRKAIYDFFSKREEVPDIRDFPAFGKPYFKK